MSEVTSTADIRRHFSKEATEVVAALLAKGATIRRTKAGHLQIRSSINSQTMSLSQNSGTGGRGMDQVYNDVRRLYPDGEATLTKSDFPGGWDKDIKDVCLKAVNDYGWTFSWQNTGNGRFITIVAPDESKKTLKFNSGSKPVNPNVQALRRTILQHGTLKDDAVSAAVGVALGKSTTPKVGSVGDPNTEFTPPSPLPPRPMEIEIMVIPDNEMDTKHDRFVKHKRPWMAKRNDSKAGDKKYESHAVIEREWSDGYMDYVCAEEGCDYPPSTKPRSISSHYAMQHARGKGKHPQPSGPLLVVTEKSEPIYRKEYSPRDDRVADLANWLRDNCGPEGMQDFEFVARQALVWQHERNGNGEPGEPLTAEQVLDKIRSLVDHGEYMRQRARIDELESQLIATMENAETCKRRADDLEEHLNTVRELLSFGDKPEPAKVES